MWSSALRESMLVIAAAATGIAVVTAWPHDQSGRCSQPSPASVEMLFAPCLVAVQTTSPAYEDLEPVPPLAIPPTTSPADEPAVARRGSENDDIEATGSIGPKRRE
jgi:hypothetical protein